MRLFNPFRWARDSLGARLTASLFDFGRVNHRMHNKLFIADGAMAVAGGRNIGNEYFMAHRRGQLHRPRRLRRRPGAWRSSRRLFDQYWNSEHVFPVESIARARRAR